MPKQVNPPMMNKSTSAFRAHALLQTTRCLATGPCPATYTPFSSSTAVTSPIEVGELLCDSLLDAEDAAALSFVLLQNETIVAEKSSYTAFDGGAFTDGIGRKVCYTFHVLTVV